jgi:hypothetical protein
MNTPMADPVHTTVVGIFDMTAEARPAVEDLRGAGFSDAQIGFITPYDATGGLKGETRWEEGAEVGAAIGASIGGAAGLMVVAAMLSPIGPALVGGAIVAGLATLGAGAATGTVLGALIGLGIPEDESRWYEAELEKGKSLVIVHNADERAEEARAILRRHNATVGEPTLLATYGTSGPATPY